MTTYSCIYNKLKQNFKACEKYFHQNLNKVKLEDNGVSVTITTNSSNSNLYYCEIEKVLNDCDKTYKEKRIDFLMFHDKIIGFEMKRSIDGHTIEQVTEFRDNWFKQNVLTYGNITFIFCIAYKKYNLHGAQITNKLIKNKIKLLKQGEYKINEL